MQAHTGLYSCALGRMAAKLKKEKIYLKCDCPLHQLFVVVVNNIFFPTTLAFWMHRMRGRGGGFLANQFFSKDT